MSRGMSPSINILHPPPECSPGVNVHCHLCRPRLTHKSRVLLRKPTRSLPLRRKSYWHCFSSCVPLTCNHILPQSVSPLPLRQLAIKIQFTTAIKVRKNTYMEGAQTALTRQMRNKHFPLGTHFCRLTQCFPAALVSTHARSNWPRLTFDSPMLCVCVCVRVCVLRVHSNHDSRLRSKFLICKHVKNIKIMRT